MQNNNFGKLKPLVVILGATGTGKSKLALELAIKYNGEIINADSMQVYKGLNIVTNKVTEEEKQSIPHHLLGFLHPLEDNYSVVEFQCESIKIINRLHNDGKLPVIVGGTHYYIESILWNVLVGSPSVSDYKRPYSDSEESALISDYEENVTNSLGASNNFVKSEIEIVDESAKFDNLTNEELYKKLEEVDPEYAAILHPNDRRKISRSLDVWTKFGRRQSDILSSMRQRSGGDAFGSGKRFENVALLWLTCEQDVLEKRLYDRVDQMISAGLLQELHDFHRQFNAPLLSKQEEDSHSANAAKKDSADKVEHYQKGIFQSIGFKEFHDYLMLSSEEKETPRGKRLYEEGLNLMKQRTFKYSKRQLKWIRNRLLIRERKSFPIYPLEATDPSKWQENVTIPAQNVVESLLAQRTPSVAPAAIDYKPKDEIVFGDKCRYRCEVCEKVIIGSLQWNVHLKGSKHRKMLKKKIPNDAENPPKIMKNERIDAND